MARIHLGLYRGANGTGPVKSKKTDTPPAPVGMTAEKAPAAPKRKAWRAGELESFASNAKRMGSQVLYLYLG